MDDWKLLQDYLAGDRGAMEQLIRRHIGMVYGTACRRMPRADAEDATQVVFLLLTQRAKRISRRQSIVGWLYRATRLVALNMRKMEGRRRRLEKEASVQKPSLPMAEGVRHFEWAEYLDAALLRLRDAERAAVLLHHGEGRTLEETGGMLGITPEASRKRAERGLKKLRFFFAARGLVVPAGVEPLFGAPNVPEAMLASTLAIAHGKAAPAIVTLAKGTSIGVTLTTLTTVTCAAVVTAAFTAGFVVFRHSAPLPVPPPLHVAELAQQAAPQVVASTLPDPATVPNLGDILWNPPTALKITALADESGRPLAHFKVNLIFSQDGHTVSEYNIIPRDAGQGYYEQWCYGANRAVLVQVYTEDRALVESPILTRVNGAFVFTARLKEAPPVTGTILTPQGKPARQAQVCLWEKPFRLSFGNGQLKRDAFSEFRPDPLAYAPLSLTDDDGHYTLPPRLGPIHGVVVHDTGWAELKRDAQVEDDKITLTPWATLEGYVPPALLTSINPRYGTIALPRYPSGSQLFYLKDDFDVHQVFGNSTVPTADGHFAFQHVAADVDFRLAVGQYYFTSGQPLRPGENRIVARPVERGQSITMELVPPKQLTAQPTNQRYMAKLVRLNQESLIDSANSPAELKFQERMTSASKEPILEFDQIPPGKYGVLATMIGGSGEALGTTRIEVLATGAKETLDVGKIRLHTPRYLNVGETVPALEGITFDSRPWRLSDLRGRYVLLHLWNPTGRYLDDQRLRSIYPLLVQNGGELVSVCLDAGMDTAKELVSRHKINWPQAFISIFDGNDVFRSLCDPSGGQGGETFWLIRPDGKIAVKYIVGAQSLPQYLAADGTVIAPGRLELPERFEDVLYKVLPKPGVAAPVALQRPDATMQPGLLPKVPGLALYPMVPPTAPAAGTVEVEDPEHPGRKVPIQTKVSHTATEWLSVKALGGADSPYVQLNLVIPRSDGALTGYVRQLIMLDGKPVGKTGPFLAGIRGDPGTPGKDKETLEGLDAYLTSEGKAAFQSLEGAATQGGTALP